jgi:predicted aldo/keto reductase-like oxidoreductase
MLFYLDTHEAIDAMYKNGVIDYVLELKKSGKVRAIGASTHNPDTAKRLVEDGLVEMLMFSINPAFDIMPDNTDDIIKMIGDMDSLSGVGRVDPKRAELYRLCESKGVGITVMKAFGAGKLLSADHSPFAKAMTPAQCIHYALSRPAVSSVLVGCSSRSEVEEAVKYLRLSDTERDYTAAISTFREGSKGSFKGSCVYCNHCLPCPANINVAAVHKYLDIAMLDEKNIPKDIMRSYKELNAHGSDCTECGNCEERCPFSVSVIKNMRKAAEIF